MLGSLLASTYLLAVKLMGGDIGNRPLLTLAVVLGLWESSCSASDCWVNC